MHSMMFISNRMAERSQIDPEYKCFHHVQASCIPREGELVQLQIKGISAAHSRGIVTAVSYIEGRKGGLGVMVHFEDEGKKLKIAKR